MSADPIKSERPADDPPPDAVDRAAALDDFFGGFASTPPGSAAGARPDDSPLPGSLDLLLLLRQAAARGAEPPAKQPESIGRYRIVRLAGRGGFSMVWEAYDPVLHRRVALKACTPDALVSPAVRRRFRREAELASRLVHPHIVTIHEVGEADGLDFITSEFCEGGTLAEWLGRHPGPMPPQTAARIARAIAQAAAHAHQAGIIHRDIKPANVLLVPVGASDAAAAIIPPQPSTDASATASGMTVKLADFGLGRQSDPGDGDDPLTQLTTEGSRLGTPAWMAPEQIDRSFGDVGPATDVHAIGLLLDRMLTGRPLRGGKTDVETFREVLLDEPVAASRSARGVSPDLAAVCLRCLAKRPTDRYESAVALADDLVRWLAGLPTRARPMSPAQRLGRSIARRPVVAALLSTALLASCIAGWSAIERSRERFKGAAQQEELRRQNAAAELRRGFESLRAGNVAGAIDHITNTRSIDPVLASSLATRWLERRLHGERATLLEVKPADAGTRVDLHSLAVSPDGRTVVVGGADGSLRILRDVDGQPRVQVILAHDEINDVCFSPDGRLFATAGQDGRVRWWSMDEPTSPDGETPPTGCPLYGVCFGADSASILYGGEDRVLRRIEIAGGMSPLEIHRFEAPEGASPEIEAICRAGDTVVVACGGVLTALDPTAGRVLWSQHHTAKNLQGTVFHALAISPAGDRIAAGGTDREPSIRDASGQILAMLPAHPNWVQASRFSADGKFLATACRDGVVRVFDAATGALLEKLVGHVGRVWDVDFEPDGRLLTAGADGTLRRWNRGEAAPATLFRHVPVDGSAIRMIREAIASLQKPNRHSLVAIRERNPPLLVDLSGADTRMLDSIDQRAAYSVAVDHARGRMAFGFISEAGAAAPFVLPLQDTPPIRTAPIPEGGSVGHYLCWTPDGMLVTNSLEGRIVAWLPSLDRAVEVGRIDAPASCVEAAPSGATRVAVAGKPGAIIHFERASRAVETAVKLDDVGDTIAAMAWSPDGTRLACGLRNGSLHLFDGTTGKRLGSFAPHERQICDIAWSSDCRVLVTADADSLRISDIATLSTFDELRPGWQIDTMCLAGDDCWIAVAGRAAVQNPDEQARLAILDLDPQ